MLIELPRCNFKYCHYCFDGNCHKKTRDVCDYHCLKEENKRLQEQDNRWALSYANAVARNVLAKEEAYNRFATELTELYSGDDITDELSVPIGVIKANIRDILSILLEDEK